MPAKPPRPVTLSYSAARSSFKAILDSSDRGGATTIRRGQSSASIVNSELLLKFLMVHNPPRVEVVFEDGAWAMFMPGQPLAAEGATVAEATADFIEALREYAQDWEDRLQSAPNHQHNWALVQIVELSSDAQLASWLGGGAE